MRLAPWFGILPSGAGKIRQFGGLMDLFIALFSEAGTWSATEIAVWHKGAGLELCKPKRMMLGPDLALHIGRKPENDWCLKPSTLCERLQQLAAKNVESMPFAMIRAIRTFHKW